MTTDEITKRLKRLMNYCNSMIIKDDQRLIWKKDMEALNKAIYRLEETEDSMEKQRRE